jgi:hypothetical protein
MLAPIGLSSLQQNARSKLSRSPNTGEFAANVQIFCLGFWRLDFFGVSVGE